MAERLDDIDKLLENGTWVRRLARRVLYDESLVDDVVQETWITAIQKPPSKPQALAAWLSAVVRNLALRANRSRTRRNRYESEADRQEEVVSPDRIVERLEVQQSVAAAIAELREPYRSVVYLHFFEDLKLVDVAERLGIPSSTVRTQLARGIDQLRDKLSTRFGGKDRLSALLLPILLPATLIDDRVAAATAGSSTTSWTGVAKVGAIMSAVVGIVLVSVAVIAPSAGRTPSELAEFEASSRAGQAAEPGGRTVPSDGESFRNSATSIEDRLPDAADAKPNSLMNESGSLTVLDRSTGEPISGARIFRAPGHSPKSLEIGTTDARGRLAIGDYLRDPLIVIAPGYVEFREPEVLRDLRSESYALELEPEHECRVTVLASDGSPAVGAEVVVAGQRRGMTQPEPETFVCDGDGQIVYTTRHYQTELRIGYAGHATRSLHADPPEVVVRLARGRATTLRVLDADRRPIADARITLRSSQHTTARVVRSDVNGECELGTLAVEESVHLALYHAEQPGYQKIAVPPSEGVWELQLPPGRTVSGSVTTSEGALVDGGHAFLFLRADARVRDGPASKLNARRSARDSKRLLPLDRAAVRAGRFEIGPVIVGDAEIYLGILHPKFVNQLVRLPSVPGELHVVVDSGRSVTGRVTSPTGVPLGDVRLHLGDRWSGGTEGIVSQARTREDGSFVLRGVPTENSAPIRALIPGTSALRREKLILKAFAPDELLELDGVSIVDSPIPNGFEISEMATDEMRIVAAARSRSSVVEIDFRSTLGAPVRALTPAVIFSAEGPQRVVLFRNQTGGRFYSDHTLTLSRHRPVRMLLLPEEGEWMSVDIQPRHSREILELSLHRPSARRTLYLPILRGANGLAAGFPFGSAETECLVGLGPVRDGAVDLRHLPEGRHRLIVLRDRSLTLGSVEPLPKVLDGFLWVDVEADRTTLVATR